MAWKYPSAWRKAEDRLHTAKRFCGDGSELDAAGRELEALFEAHGEEPAPPAKVLALTQKIDGMIADRLKVEHPYSVYGIM